MDAKQIKSKRIVYLVLSTATLLFLGLIYAFSMFAAPMCQSFGLEKSAVGLTFNIMMITFCVGAVIGSQLEKIAGVKVSIIISGILFALGFIGTGFLGAGNIAVVYGFYGVCAGTGVGIGYNSIIATTNNWFPDTVGISSGVLMMGFGLGSLIFGTLAVNVYNGGVPLSTVYLVIGLAGGIVTCLCGFVLQRPPADIVAIMCPDKAVAAKGGANEDESALKTPLFYVYWVWAFIVIAVGLATIGNCASDAQLVGWDVGFATLLVGLVSTFNGFGRIFIGMLFDKTNVKVTMLVDGIVAIIATVSIIGAFAMNLPVLYVVGALCCGVCYGGVPVVASAFARQRFGAKNYPLNLSLANFAIVWGSILNLIIQNVMGNDARLETFMVLCVLTIIAVLDVIPFSKMFNKSQNEAQSADAELELEAATK